MSRVPWSSIRVSSPAAWTSVSIYHHTFTTHTLDPPPTTGLEGARKIKERERNTYCYKTCSWRSSRTCTTIWRKISNEKNARAHVFWLHCKFVVALGGEGRLHDHDHHYYNSSFTFHGLKREKKNRSVVWLELSLDLVSSLLLFLLPSFVTIT